MISYWNEFLTGFFAASILFVFLYGRREIAMKVPSFLNREGVNLLGNFLESMGNKTVFWLIFLCALLVRGWGFGDIPAGFNQDGAMAAVDAKALADYGTDRFGMNWPVHFTAWGYGQMSVLLSYMMVPFIKIGGLNEVTARLPMLLLSLAGMLALYGLVKNIFGRTAGLIVFFLVAINPWHIMQSRWALDCNLFPHFFVIGCFFLHKAVEKRYFLHFAMVSFALCMYSYGVAFFSVPIFLMVVAIYSVCAKVFRIKDILWGIGTYAFFAWPIWAVMVINFMRWPSIETPFFTIPFFPDSVRSGDILFFSANFYEQLGHNINALLKTVVWQSPDLPWNALDNYGTQYQFALPLVLLGCAIIINLLFAKRKIILTEQPVDEQASLAVGAGYKFGLVILLVGTLVGLWIGLVVASVNVNRINLVYYFLIIVAAIGLSYLHFKSKVIFWLGSLSYVIFFILFCHHYFSIWSKEIGPYFFSGMTQALEQAATIDTPKYYITVNSQSQGARTVSEIVTMFKHQIDATYFQGVNFTPETKALSSATIAGNKYALPYVERYKYIDPFSIAINPTEKAVYIVKDRELVLFNPTYFDITSYGNYALVKARVLTE